MIAEKKPVHLTQTLSGTLEAETKIRLYNEESGRITKLPYYEGDTVKKGTLLIQLDDELIKVDLAKARASREQAKVDLNRLKKLLPKKISTEEEVAKARTELDLAIAEEKRQKTRLDRTSIKAPIDGLITRRFFEPGDHVPPQSHIHSIIDPSVLRLKASIAERWIPLIEIDQKAMVTIDALGGKKFTADITRIHPTIDADTHKGVIEVVLNPTPENAKVGQFSRVIIDLKSDERLIIPVHSVHFEPDGAFVYRVVDADNGKQVAEKTYVIQGQQFGEFTEIVSGLDIGDKVVSRGYLALRDGKKVEIVNHVKMDQLTGAENEDDDDSQTNSETTSVE
jgi:RND family efflux transporter MFP subunit